MAEAATGRQGVETFSTEQGEGTGEHWSNGHEDITSNADLHSFVQKSKTVGDLAKSYFELQKKMGSSFRLPDDLKALTEAQQSELISKVHGLKNIPEAADGYEITVPEGLTRDEAFETAFKSFAKEQGFSQKEVAAITDFYHNALLAAKSKKQQDEVQDAQAAETQYRILCGADYDKKMEGIKRLRMAIAKELNLGYEKEGELTSKLDDALERLDANGKALGNDPVILQFLSHIYEKFYAEGEPIEGSGSAPGEGGDFFSYKTVDKG